METREKIEALLRNHEKQLKKYHKRMSYRILPVEVDALYNLLILRKRSEYELTRRWESKVAHILNISL